jgi:hypothetical protein
VVSWLATYVHEDEVRGGIRPVGEVGEGLPAVGGCCDGAVELGEDFGHEVLVEGAGGMLVEFGLRW